MTDYRSDGMPSCIVCGTTQQRLFHYHGFQYYRCPGCRTVSTYPLPDEEALRLHYAQKFRDGNYRLLYEYAQDYTRVYEGTARRLARRLAARGKSLADCRVLDVGCFTGDFLVALAEQGADVYGLELQPEAVAIANEKLPGRIRQADVFGVVFPKRTFRVVTLLGVIEHVLDPIKLLGRCADLLEPGGILMLQTPDSQSVPARLMGRLWPPYAPVEHIHLFSCAGLRHVLGRLGFTDVDSRMQWKTLPLNYAFCMLKYFGPELHGLCSPFYRMLPLYCRRLSFPFYVGGVTMMAEKELNGRQRRVA